jgi:hypothetical protein
LGPRASPVQFPAVNVCSGHWIVPVVCVQRAVQADDGPAKLVGASTIAGPWDGTPVDHGRIVGHLATAGGLA